MENYQATGAKAKENVGRASRFVTTLVTQYTMSGWIVHIQFYDMLWCDCGRWKNEVQLN